MVIEPQASSSLLPSQQQLLLRIQHQATLESNLVIVSGHSGAGKYTIASALLEQYGQEFNLAWVTCHEKSSTDSLRHQLVSQLLSSDAHEVLSLHQHLSLLGEDTPLRWLIVINQAELMGNPLLVELWSLVEHCRQHPELSQHISIVLFAEPEWSRQVAEEMESITGFELPVMPVPALTLSERKQLFVVLQSRLEDEVKDVELSERLLGEQSGLPSEVVAMFDNPTATSSEQQEADVSLAGAPSAVLSNKKIWLIAVAVLLPALTILWWAYQGDTEPEPIRRAAPEPALIKPNTEMLTPPVDEEPEADTPKTALNEALPETVTEITLTTSSEDESHKQRVEVDEPTLKAIEASTSQQVEEQSTAIEPSSTVSEMAPAIEPEEASPPPQVETVQEPVKPLAWWQQVDSTHFVLQVAVMSSEQGIQMFAQKHQLAKDLKFRVYKTLRSDRELYIGVYGDYSTKEEARAGAQELKRLHQQLSPWPKSVAAVKQEAILLD